MRDIAFAGDIRGAVIARSESDTAVGGEPKSRSYRFGGRAMGEVGNDGTGNVDYTAAIARRGADGSGAFRGGATTGTPHADFDLNHVTMAGEAQAGGPGGYTARGGETLAMVAQSLWGDAGLWYKLAEANGLSAASTLAPGQRLTVPAGVLGNQHTAATLQPYDPARAIGDVNPSTPKPPAQGKNCGTFGQIMLAVVAIAVTVVTAGAALSVALPGMSFASGLSTVLGANVLGATLSAGALSAGVAGAAGGVGALAIGAGAAAAGSIVSQGVGVATGLQNKFSWKAVGLAALGGGVGAGIGPGGIAGGSNGLFSGIGSSAAAKLGAIGLRAAAGSAIGQGIGVATGLQSKFSWAGVAAAGVGAVAGYGMGRLGGGQYGQIAASGLAQAATRSAITGDSFGDSLRAQLPDIIGQAIGNVIAGGIAAGREHAPKGIQLAADDSSGTMTDAGTRPGDLALAEAIRELRESGEIVVTGQRMTDAQKRAYDAQHPRGFLDWVDSVLDTNLGGDNPHAGRSRLTASERRAAIGLDQRFAIATARHAAWTQTPMGTVVQYADYFRTVRIRSEANRRLAQFDMAVGGYIAAWTAPVSLPLLAEGGVGSVVGGVTLAADANHVLGATAPLTGATKLPLDYLAGDGASTVLDIGALGGNLTYGGYYGVQSLRAVAAESNIIQIGPYRALRLELEGTGLQANHLNQNAAFRDVIPQNEGLAIGMRGNALTEPGTAHYEFHASLESFWSPYRNVDSDLFGLRPTNAEYGAAMERALTRSGYVPSEAANIASRAAMQRSEYGLAPSTYVPRVPGPLRQSGR